MLSQATRRHYLMTEESDLLGPEDPLVTMLRSNQLVNDSSLGDKYGEPFIFEDLITIPLPIRWPSETSESRFEGLNPEIAWLPLWWLPGGSIEHDDIGYAYPYALPEPKAGSPDTEPLEPIDEWAYRVVRVLELTGLYDPETGLWVDVLATFAGVDTTTAAGRDRVSAWLGGGEDPAIEGIPERIRTLIGTVDELREDPLLLIREANEEAQQRSIENRHAYAQFLVAHIDSRGVALTEDGSKPPDEEFRQTMFSVTQSSTGDLETVVTVSEGRKPYREALEGVIQRMDAIPAATALSDLNQVLNSLIHAYEAQQGFTQEDGDVGEPGPLPLPGS